MLGGKSSFNVAEVGNGQFAGHKAGQKGVTESGDILVFSTVICYHCHYFIHDAVKIRHYTCWWTNKQDRLDVFNG